MGDAFIGYIIIGVIIGAIIYMITTRNKLVELLNDVKTQQSNIGNYEELRKKYLSDAMNIANLANYKETETLRTLTSNEQYDQLMFLGQKYPELTSINGYNEALSRVFELSNNISASKTLLNGNINVYNKAIQAFPANIVAAIFKFKRETLVDELVMDKYKTNDTEELDFSQFK